MQSVAKVVAHLGTGHHDNRFQNRVIMSPVQVKSTKKQHLSTEILSCHKACIRSISKVAMSMQCSSSARWIVVCMSCDQVIMHYTLQIDHVLDTCAGCVKYNACSSLYRVVSCRVMSCRVSICMRRVVVSKENHSRKAHSKA